MFQLLPCSVCQRTLSLRKEVAEDALLKCPNCGNQFRLGDVLDAFYSPWIVVDDATTNRGAASQSVLSPTDSVLSFDNLLKTEELAEPSRSNAVTDDSSELAADNVFDGSDSFAADDLELDQLQSAEPDTLESATEMHIGDELIDHDNSIRTLELEARTQGSSIKKPRARKEDRGGFWSILQVVLGGAAAIPVTLLLLWHVVGKDIAGAGPTVAQYVPWVVPKKFRSPVETISARTGPRVPPPALGEGGFRNFDEELNAKPSEALESDNAQVAAANADSQETNVATTPVEDSQMVEAFRTINSAKLKIGQFDPTASEKSRLIADLFTEMVGLSEQLSRLSGEGSAWSLLQNDLKEVGRFIASTDVRLEFAKLQQTQFDALSPPQSTGRVVLSWAKEVSETESHWIVKHPDKELTIEVPKQSTSQTPLGKAFFCMGTVVVEPDSKPASELESGAPKKVRIAASFFQTF